MSIWRRVGGWTAQQVGQAAISYMGRRSTALVTRRAVTRQTFTIAPPITVYVYGTRCRLTVIPQAGDQVILDADLAGALQPDLLVEQDADGIYIIAKPRPIASMLTQIAITLTMPPDIRLVAQLTPGTLLYNEVNGTIEIPPRR